MPRSRRSRARARRARRSRARAAVSSRPGGGRRPAAPMPRPTCANSSRVAVAAITALPCVHGADRGEQELGVGVLQHEPARTRADRARRVLVEVEGREHDDARRRAARRGRRRRGSARSPRCRPCTGIRMSMSTTSGRARRASATAACAVAGLARRPRGRAATRRACGCRRGTAPGRRRGRRGCRSCAAASAAPGCVARTRNRAVVAGLGDERAARELARSRMPGMPWRNACRLGRRARSGIRSHRVLERDVDAVAGPVELEPHRLRSRRRAAGRS